MVKKLHILIPVSRVSILSKKAAIKDGKIIIEEKTGDEQSYILAIYKRKEKIVLTELLAKKLIPWELLVKVLKKVKTEKIGEISVEVDYMAEHTPDPETVYLTVFKELTYVPRSFQPLSIPIPFETLQKVIRNGKLEHFAETIKIKMEKKK